ncbi:MAG: NfeD family protein [Thermoguttaceae bacterium]
MSLAPPRQKRRLWFVAMVLATVFCVGAVSAEPAPPVVGRFLRVTLPVTGQGYAQIRRAALRAVDRARREKVRLTLIFEFDVPKGQKDFGRGSEFGASLELANFLAGDALGGVRTVAYVPQPIEGHALLAVLACQEIVMASQASIGSAGVDEKTLTPTVRSAYAEIARKRRTVPVAVALGLLDPSLEVLQVETEAGDEMVTPDRLVELQKTRTTKPPVVLKRVGQAMELTGVEARRLGVAGYLADDRRALIKGLELARTAVEDDPSLLGAWRPVRVDLKGPIRADTVAEAQRMIENQVREHEVNFVCLWIDSPGGAVAEAMRLADFLAFQLDPSRVRTVAYVPHEARSDAALVALACDQVVVGPSAILGGPGAYELSPDEIEQTCQTIRKALAPRKDRSWSLLAAMIDPRLTVFRATRLGQVEYFCDAELAEQPDPAQWQRGAIVTTPGVPLKLIGRQAVDDHLANCEVDDFTQFKRYYDLADDPALVGPGWADFLVRALASSEVAALLLMLGGVALYIELHSPGLGVGGFAAAVCFLLFFWSRYLGGTAGWLEVSLFLAGVSCLLLEIFVIPGFGIFGLGGGALVLVSLILASQTFVWPRNEYQFDQLERSLLTILAAGVGLLVIAICLRHRLPRTPWLGRMMLQPPDDRERETIRQRESLVDFHDLLGRQGTATTQLTPGGKAQFGDLLVDVLADGEVLQRGTTVEVVDVRGSRVLVQKVESGE